MRKDQIDKLIWKWIFDLKLDTFAENDISKEQLETSYRLRLTQCSAKTCRRNCRGNPLCLWGLGEKEWLNDSVEDSWQEDDFITDRRAPHEFVGLKNLGATCYANSLLQLWYHNLDFRNAIYQWEPQYDPQVLLKSKDCEDFNLQTSVVGQLQRIFALLQFSHRRFVNPTPFISALGLDTGTQQDAEEFSKLFISLLEEKLSYQRNPLLSNIIQDQFQGKYAYITKCLNCQSESKREACFYELDLNIRGHKELQDSLKEFMHEEKLEGSNQYFCAFCQSKNDAVRYIKLLKLPPVLNLQLLRFVFDRQAGTKKKLNSFISFPKTLSWSEISPDLENNSPYDLSAVLIHRGPGANAGHYVAHILDEKSHSWYKFNDEDIIPVGKGKFELGIEKDGLDDNKKMKSLKPSKGLHASNNAYMLVYTRRDLESVNGHKKFEPWVVPEHLKNFVDKDNFNFEEMQQKLKQEKILNRESGKIKQTEVRELYLKMLLKNRDEYEFVPVEWLKSWLSKDTVGNIDNCLCFCRHNRLDPDKIVDMKCISLESANFFFSKYGGGPRITNKDLCSTCIYEKCVEMRRDKQVNTVGKAILKYSKEKVDAGENAFWVGKQSLRYWKKLLVCLWNIANGLNGTSVDPSINGYAKLEDLEDAPNQASSESNEENNCELGDLQESDGGLTSIECVEKTFGGSGGSEHMSGPSYYPNGYVTAEQDLQDTDLMPSMSLTYFNEDIVCLHGNLRPDSNCRRLVKEEFWNYLKGHFHDAPVFAANASACDECYKLAQEAHMLKESHKSRAAEQKMLLAHLYSDRNRPSLTNRDFEHVFVISTEFTDSWKKFIRDPLKKYPVFHINNRSLLCPEHGGLLWDVKENEQEGSSSRFVLVWPVEWEVLSNLFTVDTVICIDIKDNELIAKPNICDICLKHQKEQEKIKLLDYCNANIYVRKITDSQDRQESSELHEAEPDVQPVAKKKKISSTVIRRSERPKRLRGEKEIQVSSSLTLMDLKIQVMKLFSVPPFDQHLYLNGAELLESSATLADLRVYPGCLLLLKADEVMGSERDLEDVNISTDQEVGFKGTELIRTME